MYIYKCLASIVLGSNSIVDFAFIRFAPSCGVICCKWGHSAKIDSMAFLKSSEGQ
jgi:hypothetical protein